MDKLYFFPFACSLVAHGLMHELGHPHEAIALKAGPQGLGDDGFAALQPARTVPVLVSEGTLLTQSASILQYLAERYPSARLLPEEATAKRAALSLLGHITSDVHPTFRTLLAPERFVSEPSARRELLENGRAQVTRRLALLDERLRDRPYFTGEHFSLIDPYALVFSLWCKSSELPYPARLADLARRVAERPGYRRALAIEEAARAAA
jgi:glutathione S-transferase